MKAYEAQETHARFLPNVPIIARIDGRCFSKFTKRMDRPFDERFSLVMRAVTASLVQETGACIGYTQSDEISLCWYTPKPGSDIFFGGRKFKMTAQLAALATAYFHIEANKIGFGARVQQAVPTFDARIFQVPTLEEGVNAFLWRQRDCEKNAVSMVARAFFSHVDLLNKHRGDMLDMLDTKDITLDQYPWQSIHGAFIRKEIRELLSEDMTDIPVEYRPTEKVLRSYYAEIQLPLLSKLNNAVDVVFFGAEPLQKI